MICDWSDSTVAFSCSTKSHLEKFHIPLILESIFIAMGSAQLFVEIAKCFF